MISEEQLKEWACKVNENNDIPGKRYDWSKDFQFTDSVINDLRDRDLLKMGLGIQVLVPVNREDAPNYYRKGDGVVRQDGKLYNGKEPDRHDLEPYDILHISLSFDHENKSIGIDRYYGHRKDWVGENHTGTHRDWNDIPPISKSAVDSIMNAYKNRGVTEGILKAIDEYIERRVGDDVYWHGNPPNPYYNRNYDNMDDFEKSDKRKLYKEKSTDPRFLKWLQKYIDKHTNSRYVKDLQNMCAKIESGEIFSYTYNFFEPEEPSEEYIAKKAEDHRKSEDAINKSLSDYYANSSYTGD